MRLAALLLLALVAAAAAWVRLAPSDPARWHADPALGAEGPRSATQRLTLALPPAEALATLAAIAESTPRTLRLSGSPQEGRITWVSRSRLWGFPDYTTAAALPAEGGTTVVLHARARFGHSDLGVNRARLAAWAAALAP